MPVNKRRFLHHTAAAVLQAACLLACTGTGAEVNVYSARQESLIKPLLERFTARHGIETRLVTGKADALLTRLTLEGKDSPADLLITTDAGRLYRAKEAGLLQPVPSKTLAAHVPKRYRDPDNQWFGLSLRARTILVVEGRVQSSAIAAIARYESLADPAWRGRICIRSSDNIYNQSLVASMIHANGHQATLAWARGLTANLARPPAGGDRDQIMAAAGGLCDVAVVNTYYLAMMLQGGDAAQQKAARQMRVVWPNQGDRGVHVNVSGAGVTRTAKHYDEAVALLEYLVSEDAQRWYGETNNEYPVRAGVAPSELLQSWGEFKADTIDLAILGRLNREAVELTNRAGWR